MFRSVSLLLLCLFVPVALMAGDEAAKTRLSEGDVRFLSRILTVSPGMIEADLRARFPDLGTARTPHDQGPGIGLELPEFPLGGLKWRSEFRLRDGKVSEVHLRASAFYPGIRIREEQTAPREEVRATGLRLAEWFQNRIGKVTERFVPNYDCPAGNPFGLRHTWLTRRRAVAVEFGKNASMSTLEISLADWSTWNREQKKTHDSSWPLQPPRPEHLREAASPHK